MRPPPPPHTRSINPALGIPPTPRLVRVDSVGLPMFATSPLYLRYRTDQRRIGTLASRLPSRHGTYRFLFASGLATSRAWPTKSCAVGLNVRFFKVTIPIGTRACCSSTGNTLISGGFENLNTDIGTIVRKRPHATRLIRTSGGIVKTAVRG